MFYDSRNKKALATLDPVVREKVIQLLERLEKIGEDILIYSAKRTYEEQDELYARGRKKPGRIVTHVNDGYSFHTHGVAIDIVPVSKMLLKWNAYDRYQTVAREAIELGFEWGYQLWGFDWGHFHYRKNLTLEDFRAGKKLVYQEEMFNGISEMAKNANIRAIRRAFNRFTGRTLSRILLRLQRRGILYSHPSLL